MGTPGIGGAGIVEPAAGVCPTTHFRSVARFEEGVIAFVGVCLYVSPVVSQERHGPIPAVGRGIVKHRRAPVTDVRPEIALAGLGTRVIQKWNVRKAQAIPSSDGQALPHGAAAIAGATVLQGHNPSVVYRVMLQRHHDVGPGGPSQ